MRQLYVETQEIDAAIPLCSSEKRILCALENNFNQKFPFCMDIVEVNCFDANERVSNGDSF